MIPQGSFAQKTIIKPPDEGDIFDADVLLHLELDPELGPEDYVPLLAGAFEGNGRYENKIELGKRSVTLNLRRWEFHLDLVPFIVADNGQFITNCETEEQWEESDPRASGLARQSGRHRFGRLVEVIRLAKCLASALTLSSPRRPSRSRCYLGQ